VTKRGLIDCERNAGNNDEGPRSSGTLQGANMSSAEQQDLKQAIKEAITEAMRENRDIVKEIFIEVLENMALLQHMEEGRQSEFVGRDEIMELLEPKP
jgi:hypothetical protein